MTQSGHSAASEHYAGRWVKDAPRNPGGTLEFSEDLGESSMNPLQQKAYDAVSAAPAFGT